ncbi:DNA primase family protein, partial [Yersinia enterocolitica]
SQILQKLAKAKVKQAQLYNEAGELLEDWTPQLQEITTSQRTVIHSHDSATPALNQMGASQRGQVLLAHYGGELAIDSDSDTVHHYNGVIWEPVTDKELQREMASIFSEAEVAYSQSGVKSAVDTMKLSLPQMGTPSRQMIGFNNGVFDLKTGTFREHRRDDWLLIASGVDFS